MERCKRWIYGMIILGMVLFISAGIPLEARAESRVEQEGISIKFWGKELIDSENLVKGSYVMEVIREGSATYSPSTHKLTLKEAYIGNDGKDSPVLLDILGGDAFREGTLTIECYGECGVFPTSERFGADEDFCGIRVRSVGQVILQQTTDLFASGSLELASDYCGKCLVTDGNLTIRNLQVKVIGADNATSYDSTAIVTGGDLVIERKSKVTMEGKATAGISCGSLTVDASTLEAVGAQYGIRCGQGTASSGGLQVSGNSQVTASGGTAAIQSPQPGKNYLDITPSDGKNVELTLGDSAEENTAHYYERAHQIPLSKRIGARIDSYPYMKIQTAAAPHENTEDDEVDQDDPEPVAAQETVTAVAGRPCDHDYAWEVYEQATATKDGILRYRCRYCGDVQYEVPTAAYYVFNKDTQEAIKSAKTGATVNVETPIFISFHEMVRDALVARSDVTLVVTYRNQGRTYEMTIPAGSGDMLTTLFGDSQYAGFLYLGGAFATVEK